MQNQPITEMMIHDPLVVNAEDTLDSVVDHLCQEKQEDEEFFNDIVVLQDGEFMGLLSVREVLTNHIENLSHLLTATSAQKQALSNKNKQLFDNNFRSGFMGSQFRMLFEEAYLPMLFFRENGELDAFNRRFVELTGIPRHHLEKDALFGQLFDAPFNTVMEQARKQRDSYEGDPGILLEVPLKLLGGNTLDAEVYFETTADKRRLMANIVTSSSPEEEEGPPRSETYATPSSGSRKAGKITQAIQTKLVNEQAMGLARSVATNLIDREQSIDRMMKKLERIISVAEQIESLEPVDSNQVPTERSNLAGSLSDFSMIDLCQILAQGNKTGCLIVSDSETGNMGKLYFTKGQIVHGETNDNFHGVDSLPVLLAMRSGDFAFHLGEVPTQVTIEGDTIGLLMEACQNIDENF